MRPLRNHLILSRAKRESKDAGWSVRDGARFINPGADPRPEEERR